MSRSVNVMEIAASPAEVFSVLIDPTTYPDWLMGARATRSVDRDWPAEGSAFHHQFGLGPVRIPGSTTVVEVMAPERLVLAAGMGVLGEARVRFELVPVRSGTAVTVHEATSRGIVKWAGHLARPAVDLALWGRNGRSLTRLKDLIDRRRRRFAQDSPNSSGLRSGDAGNTPA